MGTSSTACAQPRTAARHLEDTVEALKESVEALKESNDELKAMILDQGKEIKAFKNQRNGHEP